MEILDFLFTVTYDARFCVCKEFYVKHVDSVVRSKSASVASHMDGRSLFAYETSKA